MHRTEHKHAQTHLIYIKLIIYGVAFVFGFQNKAISRNHIKYIKVSNFHSCILSKKKKSLMYIKE